MTDDSKTPEQMAEEHANIRCPEQGPEFIVWCMCRDDFLAGYQAAKPQWISVKERLPNENIKVLVLFRKRITAAALTRVEEPFYEAGYFRVWTAYPLTSTDPYEQYPWNEVTYWMPLPKPPEKGG